MKEDKLLISEDKQYVFRLSVDIVIETGDYPVMDMAGMRSMVKRSFIEPFQIEREEILLDLRKKYDESLKQTKRCLTDLTAFVGMFGTTESRFLEQLTDGWIDDSNDSQEVFNLSKEIVEEVLSSISKKDATEKEQQENFKKTMGKIPEVLKYFDTDQLELAAKDPEAWAKAMHEKMFGEQESEKRRADSERLKTEIEESIARGLRSAGMEPISTPKKDKNK